MEGLGYNFSPLTREEQLKKRGTVLAQFRSVWLYGPGVGAVGGDGLVYQRCSRHGSQETHWASRNEPGPRQAFKSLFSTTHSSREGKPAQPRTPHHSHWSQNLNPWLNLFIDWVSALVMCHWVCTVALHQLSVTRYHFISAEL